MSFSAEVFKVLIASPSDVSIERDIAVRAIQDWNDLNAKQRNVVLLPVRWETHSAPEYGRRPQEVINEQLVDDCDLLVGVFWTRLGSPTGNAISGTVEEIERIAKAGRPVMLYFSNAKQDPDKIEIDQLQMLRDFKRQTFPNALIETYSNHIEFKEKLSKQIEIQLRSLVNIKIEGRDNFDVISMTDIRINFAETQSGVIIGDEINLNSKLIEVQNFSSIPDYVGQKKEVAATNAENLLHNWISNMQVSDVNKEYFRQKTNSFVLQEFFKPIRFSVKNWGKLGARDIYIKLKLTSTKGPIIVVNREFILFRSPAKSISAFDLDSVHSPLTPDEVMSQQGEVWSVHIDIPALQPQREFSPEVEFYIASKLSNEIDVIATIFADVLAEPLSKNLKIKIDTEHLAVQADEVCEFFAD